MPPNRKGPYRPIIQAWSENLGRMLTHTPEGCEARIVCRRCKANDRVGLFALCKRYGLLFSLWSRRPPCPTCGDGLFFTSHHSKKAFDMTERTSHGEIAEIGWFSPDALPEDATRATRARLAEIFGGAAPDPNW